MFVETLNLHQMYYIYKVKIASVTILQKIKTYYVDNFFFFYWSI